MIRAVIFDVDGVLLDTVSYHYRAWKKMFQGQGVSFNREIYLAKLNGVPRLTGIKNVLPEITDEETERLAGIKQSYFLTLVETHPPSPLPGTVKLLSKLQKKDVALAAASSSKNAPRLLVMSGLDKFFHSVVGGQELTKPKPDPEIFMLASRKLQIAASSCVVVEDAAVGIEAAKRAGMKTIGLTHSGDKAIKGTADFTVHSLKNYQKVLSYLQIHA